MVEDLRARRGRLGAVVGLGGMANDFSVGIYGLADATADAAPGTPGATGWPRDLGLVADDPVPLRPTADGPAVVEAMTVLHERGGPTGVAVIARLPDGSRGRRPRGRPGRTGGAVRHDLGGPGGPTGHPG